MFESHVLTRYDNEPVSVREKPALINNEENTHSNTSNFHSGIETSPALDKLLTNIPLPEADIPLYPSALVSVPNDATRVQTTLSLGAS